MLLLPPSHPFDSMMQASCCPLQISAHSLSLFCSSPSSVVQLHSLHKGTPWPADCTPPHPTAPHSATTAPHCFPLHPSPLHPAAPPETPDHLSLVTFRMLSHSALLRLGESPSLGCAVQVNVRAAAKEVGMRAIRQASATEQREKALTQQRKANRLPLASKEDVRAAAAAVANGWMLPQGPGHIFCSSS